MKMHLIQGNFSPEEAVEIITKMVEVKISFHRKKMEGDINQEFKEWSLNRIESLQKELQDLIKRIHDLSQKEDRNHQDIQLMADITLPEITPKKKYHHPRDFGL